MSLQNNRIRIVCDTNILISAIYFGGKPKRVLQHALSSNDLITNDFIVDELTRYIKEIRPREPQKFTRALRMLLQQHSRDYDVVIDEEIRDINDTDILRLAIKQQAVIVTGDEDLLTHKSTAAVTIISAKEYCELFDLE